VYAENLQDGLPVRENPDNNARRVYRLRLGDILKVLELSEGTPAISSGGEPLPGEWYKVLTQSGITGYCFSYRLRIFHHSEGPLEALPVARREAAADPELDMVLARTWSPESYHNMVNSGRIDINEFEKHWRFDPGHDTGIAKIILPDLEREFVYEGIVPDGARAWHFEGTSLQMNLRTNTTLAVQYNEASGGRRTLLFVALSTDVGDLIVQETTRRAGQYIAVYNHGPEFTSNNYGTITFTQNQRFTWTGFDLLVPHIIHSDASGNGQVLMDLFLTPSFEERYTGAFTFRFADAPSANNRMHFLYTLDREGLRLEVSPEYAIEDITVTRRSSSPMILYFYRDLAPF
jgi:hypothetical protein